MNRFNIAKSPNPCPHSGSERGHFQPEHGPELSGRLAAAYLSCWTTHAPRAKLIGSVPAVMGLGAVFQAVHSRERIRPMIDTYQEIRSAIPGYAREVLAAE